MSATPQEYNRQASFTGFATPERPTVGQDLEAEFNAIETSLDETQARLAEIQRDDGMLANESVHPNALSKAVRAILATRNGTIKGDWLAATEYEVGDVVVGPDGLTWICAAEHVSDDFDVDVAAVRWVAISGGSGGGGGPIGIGDVTGLASALAGKAPVDAFYALASADGDLANGAVVTGASGQINVNLVGAPGSYQLALGLANTGVTAGTYNSANVTVDATGRITAIAEGAGGGGSGGPGTWIINRFTAFAGQSGFALSANPGGTNAVIVDIDGVIQKATVDYVVSGSNLNLTSALEAGQVVQVRWGATVPIGTTSAEAVSVLDAGGNFTGVTVEEVLEELHDYTDTLRTDIAATSSNRGAELVGFLQSGTGAVARTMRSKMREIISPQDFGAAGDGVADDTAEVQAAIDAALSAGRRVVGYGTYLITAKVTIKGDADFSQATFNVDGSPAIAVEVSTGNASDPTTILLNKTIWLPHVINLDKPGTGWAGQGVGVRVVNASNCHIFVGNIRNFAVGMLCTSFGTGNVYNNYYLGNLENNQVNLKLEPGNSTAWVNENNFIGGDFRYFSSEGTNVSGCYGIHIPETTNRVNNNLFLKPSIEGDVEEFHILCAGSFNTFQQVRWEATTPKIRFTGTSANSGGRNFILGGYTLDKVQVSYSGTTGKNNVMWGAADAVFEMGTSGKPLRFQNISSSGSSIHRFYEAGLDPWANGSDWAVDHSSVRLDGKRGTDTNARIRIDYVNGRYYSGTGGAGPTAYIGPLGASTMASFGPWVPGADNTHTLGDASFRWTTIYATNNVINTSDEREKQDVAGLDDAELRVAAKLKGLVRKFRFKDAVEKKGDGARIHVGVIAQEVIAAFQSEDLDAMRYGIVCFDEWEAAPAQIDADGNVEVPARNAGNRYGIRYEQLLAFIIAAI